MATAHPVTISIGATLSASLGASVRGAKAQLNQLGSTLSELGNKQSGIKQLESLRTQAKDAAVAMRASQQKVSGLEANIAGQDGGATAKQSRELERARAATSRAEESYRRQRGAVNELSASLAQSGIHTRSLGIESARLGSQLEILRARTEALTHVQQAQTRNLETRSAYRAQLVDAAALGGALYGLVKPAVEFESVMADVKKVVNFDTPEQFGEMSKAVLSLSTRIPMAADGIGAIVAAAGQAGIARSELLRFAEDAAKMGVAFDLSGQQAGAAMTGLRSIFGLTQDQVVSLGDAVNHLSNNMDAKAADLLNIANRTGSTAKLFGLSGAQVSALGATFLALKTPPEVAATGINALLMKLATADKQGEKFQQGLQDIGLSAQGMKKMIGQDAQGALMSFLTQVKKAPDVMGTLTDLFGMEYADDIAKLVGSLDTYQKATGLVGDQTAYAGSMQKEFEARSATTANHLQLLKNQMGRLGITVGNALLPALNSLVGALMKPIEGLSALAERFPLVTQVVVGTVGAVMALKVAAIALGYAWTFVKGPVLGAQTAFQSARAGLALLQIQAASTSASTGLLSLAWTRLQTGTINLIAPIRSAALAFWSMLPAIGATSAALLANPITWIVAGIGVAVAGLALVIRQYWDPMAAYVGGVFDGIRASVQPAITSLSTALAPLAPIGQVIGRAFGFIDDSVSRMVGWFAQLLAPVTLTKVEFDGLSASGQSLGVIIGGVLGAAFTLLTTPIRVVGTLVGWVTEGLTALVAFAPLATFQAAWQPVADFMTGLWSGITATVGQAIDWIASKIGWVLEAGKKVGEGFRALFGGEVTASPAQDAKPATPQVGKVVAPKPAVVKPITPVGSVMAAAVQNVKPKSAVTTGIALQPLQAPSSSARVAPQNTPVVPPRHTQALTARPVVSQAPSAASGGQNISISAPITVNAAPGMDAREIAAMIESRLNALMRDASRRPATAMYD